jgi:hypothetical protein
VTGLVALWPRLPALTGRDWPELAVRLRAAAGRFAAATTAEDCQLQAGRLLRLLRNYPAVREYLRPLYDIDADRIIREPQMAEPPGWPTLAHMVACAAQGNWISAVFDGYAGAAPPRDGQPHLLRFTVDAAAQAEAFQQAQLQLVLVDGEDSVRLRVECDVEQSTGAAEVAPVQPFLTVHRTPQRSPFASGQAVFQVTLHGADEITLRAIFYHGTRIIQTMLLVIPAGECDDTVQRSSVRPLTTATTVREPGLSLLLFSGPGGQRLHLIGTHSYQAELPYNLPELDSMADHAREGLRALLRDGEHHGEHAGTYEAGVDIPEHVHETALRGLARSGFWFYQSVFRGPKSNDGLRGIGDLLRAYGDGGGQRIQVVTDGVSLPWHLMYLDESYDQDRLDPGRILGFRHQIDYIPMCASTAPRYLDRSPDQLSEPGVLLAVNDDIDTPAADWHRTLVADQVHYWRRQTAGPLTVLRHSDEVTDALANPQPNHLSYFYCHLAGTGPDDCSLVFTGYQPLSLRDLEVHAPSHLPFPGAPLIVVNACDSVALTPALYSGLLPYFISKGAGGVIGTEVAVPAVFAAEWARLFFDRLLAGEPVGLAIFKVRHQLLAQHRNVLGLLYTAHCEGDTVLQRP